MTNEAWMVSTGEYSDYSVWCVFEREEDARAYARHVNEIDMRADHKNQIESARRFDGLATYRSKLCKGAVETCPLHGKYWEKLDTDGWSCRVERVQWWPAGVVPVYRNGAMEAV